MKHHRRDPIETLLPYYIAFLVILIAGAVYLMWCVALKIHFNEVVMAGSLSLAIVVLLFGVARAFTRSRVER